MTFSQVHKAYLDGDINAYEAIGRIMALPSETERDAGKSFIAAIIEESWKQEQVIYPVLKNRH